MRKLFTLTVLVLFSTLAHAQLTVEKIMEDPAKWIGTSPGGISWSEDSRTVYFNWNPEKNRADSLYKNYPRQPHAAESKPGRKKCFGIGRLWRIRQQFQQPPLLPGFQPKTLPQNGNIYLQDTKTLAEKQLTRTLDRKGSPSFNADETKVIYSSGDNLFTLDIADGKNHPDH
ncbi:MAG: hypothetical protein LRY55_12140 [Leadbetterella sp.]|nr:hypothetical protein [Leadbetterella sp.]